MSLIDTIRRAAPDKPPTQIPPSVAGKLRRAREERDKNKVDRVLCQKFWENDPYWYKTTRGQLSFQASGMTGVTTAGKPGYRVRNKYSFLQAIIEAKVSQSTQQIPSYEITPSTDDYQDEAAAKLASQVAIYGYDEWRLRRHTIKAVTTALVTREGFVMPYFDPDAGPYKDGRPMGNIRLQNYTRDEVMWEPGEDFDDSRWHAIEKKYRYEEVIQWPGYIPGSLSDPNAAPSSRVEPDDMPQEVTVVTFMERPCRRYPKGRKTYFANGRVIVDYRQTEEGQGSDDWWAPFPYEDADGTVADEPPLHRISYTVNPYGDDMGLAERIIDLQRTIQDSWNKIIEIKNRALMLQVWLPKGSTPPERTDTPGATYFYNSALGDKPVYEPAPDPNLINQLLQVHNQAVEDMRAIAADVDIQPDPRVAEGTAQLAQTTSAARWGSFLGDLAEFHSRVMRHCLCLVSLYFDEERQVQIRGQYGWEPLTSFKGQDLRSQVHVRVLPGSLATLSREAIQNLIGWFATNFPGSITPDAAMQAIQGGSMGQLLRSHMNDIAKANRIIRRIQKDENALAEFPDRFDPDLPNPNFVGFDPATGQFLVSPITGKQEPPKGADVPGWMPTPADNVTIWRQVVGDFTKTEAFEAMDDARRSAVWEMWGGLKMAEQQRAAEQAEQQQMQAQSLGMSNAASPQVAPPLPSRAGFTPGSNDSAVPEATPT